MPPCLSALWWQALSRGSKRQWNDLVLSDLKKCDLLPDWRNMAHERGAWRCLVKEASAELNRSLEEDEVKKKDERKLRREGNRQPSQSPSAHLCTEPGCNFVGQTKAGLVNHTRQRHGVSARAKYPCSHCGGLLHKQGLLMHQRFCPADSNGQGDQLANLWPASLNV